MTAPQFHFLTDPNLFAQLNRALLTEFLRKFDLDSAHRRLLDATLPPSEFTAGLCALLASPDKLPDPMCQALRAIGDLADPENKARFDHAMAYAPLILDIDPRGHPLQQALHLWLYRPFDPPPLPATPKGPASPQADSPSHPEAPSPTPQLPGTPG